MSGGLLRHLPQLGTAPFCRQQRHVRMSVVCNLRGMVSERTLERPLVPPGTHRQRIFPRGGRGTGTTGPSLCLLRRDLSTCEVSPWTIGNLWREPTGLVVRKAVGGWKRLQAFGHVHTVPGKHREGVAQVLNRGLREILSEG